ncbi:MAG: hypothetical protein RLZZ214_182 [Verrucomicrobiota bacterium]|jgi:hypothetical protein
MFRFKNHPPSSGPKKRPMKLLLLLSAAGCFMALGSCSEAPPEPPPPPTVTVTDTEPVGDGLKVIGFAMLGAAVVVVLGRMLG